MIISPKNDTKTIQLGTLSKHNRYNNLINNETKAKRTKQTTLLATLLHEYSTPFVYAAKQRLWLHA